MTLQWWFSTREAAGTDLRCLGCSRQCCSYTNVHLYPLAPKHCSKASRPRLTEIDLWQGDFVVLASEPVCICGVDVAAPQQLRARNSQHKMSMAELRSIFSRQFTDYEVSEGCSGKPPFPMRGACCQVLLSGGLHLKPSSRHRQRGAACRLLEVQGEGDG